MCTVSFIPADGKVFITSNRDESTMRATAELPEIYTFPSGKILFPKDRKAGGTWIALHENGNVMVLLNGAGERHVPQPPYRRSRGLVFLDIFDSRSPEKNFSIINLEGVEPFTLIIWQQQKELWEARWNGSEKTIIPISPTEPHIWSSVTLYDMPVRQKRETWFGKWLQTTAVMTVENINRFHEFGGEGDAANDLLMNRGGKLSTVSITGIALDAGDALMHYRDLCSGLRSINTWKINQPYTVL
ncbi:NRDE family protein [Chitinophagaceae bacterium MMS25-I14]